MRDFLTAWSIRRGAGIGAALMALTLPALADSGQGATLRILNWGGDFSRAQEAAFAAPFHDATGHQIEMVDVEDPAMPALAQHRAGNVTADLASLGFADAQRLCDEGVLAPLDPALLAPAPDGRPASEDFLPGGLGPCFVATDVYATVLAYDRSRFDADAPASPADFFDLTRFPGKRGLRREAHFNLELALLADGVPRDQIYATLATDAGLERAFAKLDSIKDAIIWWEAGAQPMQLLADGEVAITTAYNGRVFTAIHAEDQPFEIIWDGQLYEIEGWGVLSAAPNRAAAMAFVAFSTAPEMLARMAEQISYGPPRRSSAALVGNYKDSDVAMAPHLPTSADNLARGLASNVDFWIDHKEGLNARFNAWLAR